MSIPLAEFASHRLFKSALSRSGHMHSIPHVFLFTHESFSRLISSFERQIRNLEECPNMTVILMIQMASYERQARPAKWGQGWNKDYRLILKEEISGSEGALNTWVQESTSHRHLKRTPSRSGDMHLILLVFLFTHWSFLVADLFFWESGTWNHSRRFWSIIRWWAHPPE